MWRSERWREDDRPRPAGNVPATEWMRVTSSASSLVSGGRMPGSRRPSIVLPVPGGPASSTLCSPAAASSKRPTATLLTAHLREVGQERLLQLVAAGRSGERNVLLAPEVGDRLGQVVHRDDVDTGERRLGRRLGSADETGQPLAPGAFRDGDRARDRTHATVERKLPDTAVLEEPLGRELVRPGQERERNRQVEAGSFLAKRSRGEVDRDPVAAGPGQHRVDDAAVHTVLGLLAGTVGQPDDRERGQLGRDEVRLDLHAARLEADDGGGEGSREHTTDGTGEPPNN